MNKVKLNQNITSKCWFKEVNQYQQLLYDEDRIKLLLMVTTTETMIGMHKT